MTKTPRDYLFTNHHLPHAVDRFVEKFPDANMMKVNVCPDAYATYEAKFSGIIPFSPGPIYVEVFSDAFVGMFEPDTILFETHRPEGTHLSVQRFRIVQQAEWDEGLLPHHEMVSWNVDVLLPDFEEWCAEDRGIKIRRHRRGSGENKTFTRELVFEAPGSREEFLMRWRTPQ